MEGERGLKGTSNYLNYVCIMPEVVTVLCMLGCTVVLVW